MKKLNLNLDLLKTLTEGQTSSVGGAGFGTLFTGVVPAENAFSDGCNDQTVGGSRGTLNCHG